MPRIPRCLRVPYGPTGVWRKRAWSVILALGMVAAALGPPGTASTEADGPRIVAIGDSLTAGYGLAQGEGFVPQLNAWLADNGHPGAQVVNMGVSGDTTAGGKARLDWAMAEGGDAAIIALGGNDLLRGIDPAASRANLEAMLIALDGRGVPVLLAGMQAPLNYGPEYKADFDAIFPELAERYDAVLHPSFLAGLVGQPALFQSDGLHPNKDGVAQMVEAIGPRVLDLIALTQE